MQEESLGTECMIPLASFTLCIFEVGESGHRGLVGGSPSEQLTMRQVLVCVPANLQVRETFPITRA